MKKLILMTSALTLMGGMANAAAHTGGSDFTTSADASVSYGNWGTAAGAAAFDFDTSISIALENSGDHLTWGASVGIDADAGTVSDGVIFVSGGFGKVSFGIDEFDALSGTLTGSGAGTTSNGAASEDAYGDVMYEGTFGAVSATLVADAGLGTTVGGGSATSTGVAAGSATWDLELAYSGNGMNASVGTDSNGGWDLDVDRAFGSITIGVGYDDGGAWDVWASRSFGAVNAKLTHDSAGVTGVELDGTSGAIGWELSGDTAGAAAAMVSYTAAPWTASVAYDNDDAGTAGVADFGDEADIIVTVGYAASDALSFEIKANNQSEYEISMAAGFSF